MYSGLKFFVNVTVICFCCSEVFVDKKYLLQGPGMAQWLRRCAIIRTVPGSILGGLTGFFIDIFLPTVPWPWGRISP